MVGEMEMKRIVPLKFFILYSILENADTARNL